MKQLFAVLALLIFISPTAEAASVNEYQIQQNILNTRAELTRLGNTQSGVGATATVIIDGVTVASQTMTTPTTASELCTIYGLGAQSVDIFVKCVYDGYTFYYNEF